MTRKQITSFATILLLGATSLMAEPTKDKGPEKDSKFFKKAAQGGLAEVEISKLAKTNASKQDVKDFAEMMVMDHTGANTELMELAKSKAVTLPGKPDKMHQDKLAALKEKKGADFDADYVKTMTMDHEATVALFEKEAKQGEDAEVKAFAAKTLPTLKKHLEKIKGM